MQHPLQIRFRLWLPGSHAAFKSQILAGHSMWSHNGWPQR